MQQLARFAPEWTVLVVGDRKTPKDWSFEGTRFLGIEEQSELGYALSANAPFNHYARKNIGYLYAIERGAQVILETDDDNLPYDWYPGDIGERIQGRLIRREGWENVYTHFSKSRIWPRGFPLQLVNESLRCTSPVDAPAEHRCVIQQFLANDNPDVDAVFRLTNEGLETFEGEDVVIGPGTWCPFNSQNTVWHPDAFPFLYLPFTASFRMTDIWRSFVAQICVQAVGGKIAFRNATMYQKRNEHSLIRDFEDEISGYLNNDAIMKALSAAPGLMEGGSGAGLRRCYELMVYAGHLRSEELALLDAWTDGLALARERARTSH